MPYNSSLHAINRASERYGLDLTPTDLATLASTIERRGPGVLVVRPTANPEYTARSKVAVWQDGRWLLVVYDWEHRLIVTFLDRGDLAWFKHALDRARWRMKRDERQATGEGETVGDGYRANRASRANRADKNCG